MLGVLLPGAIAFAGTSTCPAPAAIAAALEELAPASTATIARARIDGFAIALNTLDGRKIGARELAARGCAEAAQEAAVLLAAWISAIEVDPDPAPMIARPVIERPVSERAVVERPVIERSAIPPSSPYELSAAAGLRASYARAIAPGAFAELAIKPDDSDWSGRLALAGSWLSTESLGSGDISWTRASISAGIARTMLTREELAIEAHADLHAALLYARGSGFSSARTVLDFDPGASLALRVTAAVPLAPFGELAASGWIRRQELYLEGSGNRTFLPQFEVIFAGGVHILGAP